MKNTSGYRVTMLLDEFAALGRLDQIATMMGLGRGYKIRLWPFLQDLSQLQALYQDKWQTFIANCGVRQFFGIRDQLTARFVAEAAGQTTILKKSGSIREISREEAMRGFSGISWSYSQEAAPFLLPQDVLRLRPNEQLLYMDGVPYVVNATRFPYWSVPAFRQVALPDPYHDLVGALQYADWRRASGLLPPIRQVAPPAPNFSPPPRKEPVPTAAVPTKPKEASRLIIPENTYRSRRAA
jgi:type IV secretory pathway TraG/TraD family ATPase VirD4